jgi:hypothetical protein
MLPSLRFKRVHEPLHNAPMIRRRFDDHRHVDLAFWQRLPERRCFLVRIQFYKKRKVRRIKNIFFKKSF